MDKIALKKSIWISVFYLINGVWIQESYTDFIDEPTEQLRIITNMVSLDIS